MRITSWSELQDFHASLHGRLYQLQHDTKLDERSSPVVAAWFDGGRKDPRVALFRFDPEVAEVWASSSASMKFGFEIVRATMKPGHPPDIGV